VPSCRILRTARDPIPRPAPLALAFDLAVGEQGGDGGVPLPIRDAGGGEDLGLGVPAWVRAQEV
jgi:hypothetical protein